MPTATPRPNTVPACTGSATTDIPKGAMCCREVYGQSWGGHPCGKAAKVERDGHYYCGTHDPVRVVAKDEARRQKWTAKWEAERADRKAAIDKQAALEQDAARYRWLRDEAGALSVFTSAFWNTETAAELDAAIDAAREGGQAVGNVAKAGDSV